MATIAPSPCGNTTGACYSSISFEEMRGRVFHEPQPYINVPHLEKRIISECRSNARPFYHARPQGDAYSFDTDLTYNQCAICI